MFLHNDAYAINLFIKSFKREHKNIYDCTSGNDKIYLQEIRNLYEHKKVIKLILERIGCCNNIIENKNQLVTDSYSTLLLCAKHNIKPHHISIKHIYNKMIELEKNNK